MSNRVFAVAFCLIALASSAPRVSALEYNIRDLGTLGGTSSWAYGINSAGHIVGWATVPEGSQYAFLWTPQGGMTQLPGYASTAYAINDYDQVAGVAGVGGTYRAFVWDATRGTTLLDVLPGYTDNFAKGINNLGQVVGYSYLRTGAHEAFIWDAVHGMRGIGNLGGNFSQALGINDAGQVVGSTIDAASKYHAFIWDEVNGMRDLGNISRCPSTALAISNSGYTVGASTTSTGQGRAVRWTGPGNPLDLGSLASNSCAYGVNNLGQAVGACGGAADRAFVWDSTRGMTELKPLVGAISQAWGINDAGLIVGTSSGAPGQWRRAVLWTPVPEPSGLLVFVGGAGGVAALLARGRLRLRSLFTHRR